MRLQHNILAVKEPRVYVGLVTEHIKACLGNLAAFEGYLQG